MALVRALVAVLLVATPAAVLSPAVAATDCPDPAGVLTNAPTSSAELVIRGRGWGHGLGMSQHGAHGAASLGCTHQQILSTYYHEAHVGSAPSMPDEILLGLADPSNWRGGTVTMQLTAENGPVPWVATSCSGCAAIPTQPSESTWTVGAGPGGVLHISDGSGTVWTGGDDQTTLRAQHEGTIVSVRIQRGTTTLLKRRMRWGETRVDTVSDATFYVIQAINDGIGDQGTPAPAMDRYLWGLAEVPSSWPVEALRAQAVAARSYAWRRAQSIASTCRCHLYATPVSQNWTGWDHESADVDRRFRNAVDDTTEKVVLDNGDGAVVDALYSATHGGHSLDDAGVWGGTNQWLQPVNDAAWDAAVDHPWKNWTSAWESSKLAATLGYDDILWASFDGRYDMPSRNAGLRVMAIKDSEVVEDRWNSWQIRQRLNLRSPVFDVAGPGQGYRPVTPARLLDTRDGNALRQSQFRRVYVHGRAGLPTSNLTAILVNVTSLNATRSTWISLSQYEAGLDGTATANVGPGEIVSKLAVVRVAPGGHIHIWNQWGNLDVTVDVLGYFGPPGIRTTTVTPTRLVDTRRTPDGRLGPDGELHFDARAAPGAPTDATVAILNVVGVDATDQTRLVLAGRGEPVGNISTVNVPPGETRANLAYVSLDDQGVASIHNRHGELDVVVDVIGYLGGGTGTSLIPTVPERAADSRTGDGMLTLGPGEEQDVRISRANTVPSNPRAVLVSVAGIAPTADTHLELREAGTSSAGTANVNIPAGEVRSNLAVVAVSPGGYITVRNRHGTIDVTLDVVGYLPT